MEIFLLISLLVTLGAIFSYVNVKWLRLPSGIALMLMGSVLSFCLIAFGNLSSSIAEFARNQMTSIDFSEFILGILLCFLLFAGSLHVSFERLKESAYSISIFSTVGVLISTFLMGAGTYYVLNWAGLNVPFIYCLLFGALISPTDPIAVLGILKRAGISKSIEIKISGESLFNDGVGVVVFLTVLQVISQGAENTTVSSVLFMFLKEAGGGIVLGLVIGYIGFKLMKSIDHFQTEIMISLAMVMGGYALCHALHVSGPIAMVVAGIFTGYKGLPNAMSDMTLDYLVKFWEVVDELLNSVLFVLIGLQLITIQFQLKFVGIGIALAILLIFFRYISLWIPAHLFRFYNKLEKNTLGIMAWGGLRGGISIALALTMPAGPFKDEFVMITYVIVLFSICVQGLTMERVAGKLKSK